MICPHNALKLLPRFQTFQISPSHRGGGGGGGVCPTSHYFFYFVKHNYVIISVFPLFKYREGVKYKVSDRSVNGEGDNPQSATKIYFFYKREKDAECSETEKYTKIFCDICARVSVTNLNIFHKI